MTPTIDATAGLPGDFDGSGFVDEADAAVWRATYGQVGSGLSADGNGDGRVDAADYSIWRDNEGAVAATGSSAESTTDEALSMGATVVDSSTEERMRQSSRPAFRAAFEPAATDESLLLFLADSPSETSPSTPAQVRDAGEEIEEQRSETIRREF